MSEENPIDKDQQQDHDPPEDDFHLDVPSPPNIKRRIFIIACILLVLVIIGVGISPLRTLVFRPSTGVAPTPTAIAGDNLFFIQDTLTGAVTIDGRIIKDLPIPNLNPPIRLAPGEHHIVWQSTPFNPLTCIVFVPSLAHGQPCLYESAVSLNSGINAWLISFSPSFSDLSSMQRNALEQKMQNTFNAERATAIVQSGEQYLQMDATGGAAPVTATHPLKATFSLHVDTDPNSSRSCVDGYGDTCSYNGQSCLQLCAEATVYASWLVTALYYPTWTYTTESGRVIAQDQPDTSANMVGTDHSADFQVNWDSAGWHVTNLSALAESPQKGSLIESNLSAGSTNPACASLVGMINSSTLYASTHDNNHILVQWSYYVGSNPSDGCLALVRPADGSFAPPAYFLYRFGVLLAADSLAHTYFPDLPVADAYEQGVAQSIAAQHKM
jgi:hypothetical protein